jgi:RNA polymerase sigma factor (sigma-70 family)
VAQRGVLDAAQRGDRDAQDLIVRAHLGVVHAIAAGYRDLGLPYDDLVQEGSLGLLEAIRRYDPSRGTAFEFYAGFRIRRSIRNALTEQGRLIRLPKHVVERKRSIDSAEASLSATGRPSLAEVATATGLSVAAVIEARQVTAPTVSLDEPVLPDGSPLEALLEDPHAGDPLHATAEREQSEVLARALASLSERQRHVICRRWGLGGRPEASGVELAEELNVSRRRTQAIAQDALYRLRKALEPSHAHSPGES